MAFSGKNRVFRLIPVISIGLLLVYVIATIYFLNEMSSGSSVRSSEPQGLLRLENSSPNSWTVDDVSLWLTVNGFAQYKQTFQRHLVDGKRLLESDQKELETKLHISAFLDAHRIVKLIEKLKSGKFAASGLGVHEVGVYLSGDNIFSSPPRQTLMSHRTANLPELLKLASDLMGFRVVRFLNSNGDDIQHGDEVPAKMIALQEGQFFVFPIESIGFMRSALLVNDKNVTIETLSDSPRVFRVKHFLSNEECDNIISWAGDKMGPSTVAMMGQQQAKNTIDNAVRTSSTAWMPAWHPITPIVRDRVASLVKLPMENAEDMQVLRYEKTQHYWSHHDYFDPNLYPDPAYKTVNRFVTVLFYLSDGFEGGETTFPYARGGIPGSPVDFSSCELGIKVAPEKGTAIVFYSMTPQGHQNAELDPASLHGSCDVKSDTGTKWAANYWIRNKRWR